MKEQLHTIPVNEAFDSGDECPFCFMERAVEQSAIRYTIGPGASYMEPDVRAETGRTGFCVEHTKKLYDYGNTLGNALILQTHMESIIDDFRREAAAFQAPAKKSLFGKKKVAEEEPYWQRMERQVNSCYICDKIKYNMDRYFQTFFVLLKDEEFRTKVMNSKGFCMRHFSQMLRMAEEYLPGNQRDWFYPAVFKLMEENLLRVKDDLDWLVAKYDYRNASADWRNSRDALQRTMQKLEGLHPADPPYKNT